MRRILLSAVKILISAALLYFALRKINFYDLASRFDIASLGWIGLAITANFLQIFLGALRWRVISADCGAPLATTQAFRFNLIGTFFNQTLPSSIGGDAVRLWLVARGGAGWRAATYSIFVDRAIGLIALAIVVVASLGRKSRCCRFSSICLPSLSPGAWYDRSRHPCCSDRSSSSFRR